MAATSPNTDAASKRRLKREERAARTRAQALSPLRIMLSLLGIPVIGLSVALSIYIRTSPFDRSDALRHLAALAGCEAAAAMGLAPAYDGEPGYHARHDPDGDGVACNTAMGTAVQEAEVQSSPETDAGGGTGRMLGGAKFVRP